jgi:hypothetical protein
VSPSEADHTRQTLRDLGHLGEKVSIRRIQATRGRMAERSGEDSVRVVSVINVEANLNDTHSTESYDDMGPVGVDPRWDVFGPFHDYLLKAFPLVYAFHSTRQISVSNPVSVIPLCP